MKTQYYLAPEGWNSDSYRDVYSEEEAREYLRGAHVYDEDDDLTHDVEAWIVAQLDDCDDLGECDDEQAAVLEAILWLGDEWLNINPLHIIELFDSDRAADVIRALRVALVAPTEEYTADAGRDYGYVAAWRLPGRANYVIQYGDNGQTNYDTDTDISDLAEWLLPEDHDDDYPVVLASVRGIDAVEAAPADYVGRVRVIITRDYYGPYSTHAWTTEMGYTGDVISEWQSAADAQAWIDVEEGRPYTLSHNESNHPTYTIVAM